MINAALGFDSYLVPSSSTLAATRAAATTGDGSSSEMGCYFCSDIVAAQNSQKDRTLDEQCTVTRPGLSNIASALCGELMVAIFQRHAADIEEEDDDGGSESHTDIQYRIDVIPHQIRGNVLVFEHILLEVSYISKLEQFFAIKSSILYAICYLYSAQTSHV